MQHTTASTRHVDVLGEAGAPVKDATDDTQTVAVLRVRLEEFEACALRAALDTETIERLQKINQHLESELAFERKRGEETAAAITAVARMCDTRVSDLEAQYIARLASLQSSHDAALAAKDARYAALEQSGRDMIQRLHATQEKLEAEHAALQTIVATQLTAVHAAVTAPPLALEIHPARSDRRQFATLHTGRVPLYEFDRTWCSAICGPDQEWKVDIDATGMLAHVTQHSAGRVVLRTATPLPRHMSLSSAGGPTPLPSYRVIIEAYYDPHSDHEVKQRCSVGLLPSHSVDGAVVAPKMGRSIPRYGGWWIQVSPTQPKNRTGGTAVDGWSALPPRATPAAAAAEVDVSTSAYATTDTVPPVPAGSAVEFAVDYAAGTCRVAFYTPEAVAGGFVESPHAKMELRFVATQPETVEPWGDIPARAVPTAAGSRVELFPAISTYLSGAKYRLAV